MVARVPLAPAPMTAITGAGSAAGLSVGFTATRIVYNIDRINSLWGSSVIEVVTIDTPSLGDRTYLATDGASALVIDPQRDIDRVLVVAGARGVTVTHVFETHVHTDYVSGGLALART
jgi:glyoxylase-like metal-dependent hydrolase (beta-lactamase superfamily II)